MSQQRPVLKGIEIVIIVVVTEFMNEGDAIPLVQGLESSPHMLVEGGKELLDVGIRGQASL